MYSAPQRTDMSSSEAAGTSANDDRWRRVVAVLDAADETAVPFDALVNQVLHREYCGDRDPTEHRRAVANALHFDVLPRLADRDVLCHEADGDRVRFDRGRIEAMCAGTEPGLDVGPATPLRPTSPRAVARRHRA